jgi:2-oxoglutarate dehydrogenase E2 component (dihydrolipoamide succinyltransferase)
MQVEVKVPQLSESVSEATLVAWRKKPGEAVKRDENLIDIETDKVVLELPAPADGVLAKIVKNDGESVTSGDLIAVIDTEAKPTASAAAKSAERRAVVPGQPGTQTAAPQAGTPAAASISGGAAAKAASPSAAKIAAEKGVDTAAVQGSGRDGRVTKADVLAAPAAPASIGTTISPAASTVTQQPQAKAPPRPTPSIPIPSGSRTEQRVPMSRLRQRVAERLVQSQSTAAILTTFNEANMAPVMELRARYKERFEKEHGVKLGFMSFFVKAAVHALRKYPVVNASIDGTDIVYHGYYDIGIAVGSERGLVVPILRNADLLSIAEIEQQIADFGRRAKDGKITIEELTGGTFSISNGGVFGSMLSTPIINPPQSAILGIHATKERPVVENGQVVIRPMNYLALSYDHRIIDGREAVLSLVAIKEALEDPARLVLDI